MLTNFAFLLEDAASGNGAQTWITYGIMFVVIIGLFYFLMIRPQKKQEKKDAEMRDALAVGDEVTTIGGIIGKVVSIKGETFVLETTRDKTKIRFLKGAIRTVDVRAEDIAASVMEAKKETEAPADAKPENATDEKTETTDENKQANA